MSTNQLSVHIYDKKLMTTEAWDTYFFAYLNTKIDVMTDATFLSNGVLDDEDIGLTGPANDQFGVDLTNASKGIDGSGNVMDLAVIGQANLDQYFENTVAIQYWVGFRYAKILSGIQNNPRTGKAEYPYYKDTIGELGNPDSVTDSGTYIRLQLNGILESGVDHSRKTVTVYLANPVAPTEVIAYYTGTIAYSAPNNYVDVPYTSAIGPLGQTAPTYTISTTATDYYAHVEGLSWFRNYNMSTDTDYVVIGKVTGSGAGTAPTTFDLTDQNKVFLISLQRAYYGNSTATPAPGRTIVADKGSVIVRQSATTNREYDDSNIAMLFDGLSQNDVAYQFPWMTYLNEDATLSSTYSAARNLADGVDLLSSEAITLGAGTNTITFTRGGVDLTTFENDFLGKYHNICCVLVNGTTNDQDGLYYIDNTSVAIGAVDVVNLDGSIPSWTADTGTARVMVLVQNTMGSDFHGSASQSDQGAIYYRISKESTGFDLSMFGEPNDPGVQRFARIGFTAGSTTQNNYFFNLFSGSLAMRGGKTQNNPYHEPDSGSWIVRGHAHFQSDKTTGVGDYLPTESYSEWGYDYRGNDFGLETAQDDPAAQWAYTTRIPFWVYDSGNEYILPQHSFTRLSATTLTLNTVGVDLTYLPCNSTNAVGGVMVEVQFDTPNSEDGVYVAYDCPTTSTLELRKLNGDSPNFPVGDGDIRLYGGVITGPSYGPQTGSSDFWMQTITPSTPNCGGLRLMHYSGQDYSSTDYRTLLQAQDEGTPMFVVRDGGNVYGRSISTKGAFSGHGITQWDQMVTSLLHADVADFSITDSRKITLNNTSGNVDFITPRSGTWSVDYTLLLHAGRLDETSQATPGAQYVAACRTDGAYLDLSYQGSLTTDQGYYAIDFKVQQGATINNIAVYVNPANVTGVNAFGIRGVRKTSLTATGTVDLNSSSWTAASGSVGVDQYVIQTCDQNNTGVDNEADSFRLILRTSQSSGGATHDLVYSAKINVTISQLGEHMLYR